MKLTKVKQPQLFRDHAYQEMKRAIIQHDFPPGQLLSERNLSESLGISRTPLRLALQQLESEGWVSSIPRKGILVQPISEKEIEEVFQLRKANEVLVVELLIPIVTDEHLQGIRKMYQDHSKLKDDHKAFISFDTKFHMHLAELSQNRLLHQLMQTLTDKINWFGHSAAKLPGRLDDSLGEHRNIVESLEKRDLKRCKLAVIEHMDQTRMAVLRSLSKMK